MSNSNGGRPDWNPDEYEARSGFDAIPKGRYLTIVDDIEEKPTKDKTGKYLEVTLTVMKGDFKNRKVWARLNVHNRSPEAQRIGREQYNAFCLANGVANNEPYAKHQSKMLVAIVDVEDGPRGPANRVTGFLKPAEGESVPPRSGSRPPAPQERSAPRKPAPTGNKIEEDDIPF